MRIATSLVAALAPVWAACTPAHPAAQLPAPAPAASSSGTTAPAATSASTEAIFKPPADAHEEDATLPAATVAVTLLDADGKPRPNETVFLAQISETPAPDVTGVTDAGGRITLSAPGWVGTSARVVAVSGGGSFYTSPFPIRGRGGVRVTLHGYECSSDIKVAKVVFSVIVLVELDGGDVEVAESFDAFVLGRVAWTPPGVQLPMPAGFSRFESANHSDSSWDIFSRQDAAVMRGTIPTRAAERSDELPRSAPGRGSAGPRAGAASHGAGQGHHVGRARDAPGGRGVSTRAHRGDVRRRRRARHRPDASSHGSTDDRHRRGRALAGRRAEAVARHIPDIVTARRTEGPPSRSSCVHRVPSKTHVSSSRS